MKFVTMLVLGAVLATPGSLLAQATSTPVTPEVLLGTWFIRESMFWDRGTLDLTADGWMKQTSTRKDAQGAPTKTIADFRWRLRGDSLWIGNVEKDSAGTVVKDQAGNDSTAWYPMGKVVLKQGGKRLEAYRRGDFMPADNIFQRDSIQP